MHEREEGDFMPSIFTREKRLIKIILNLKQINKHIEHEHCANPSRPSCPPGFSNLNGKKHCYAFRRMPNGYSETMRVFTKLLNPPYSILRSHGNIYL